eukprot:TRINITY_DN6594_c0_g1_i1.p1 TRINITY_DN6594_c0_g1~~TRINITY_DN6594_c0_g1_i1.p1  ORF type:complete len:668 (+),score=135.78 TRINITY_DN6594_c0_g1_i1:469-2472(+)
MFECSSFLSKLSWFVPVIVFPGRWLRGLPIISAQISVRELLANKAMQNFIDNVPLDCTNKVNGCQYRCPKDKMPSHAADCLFSPEKLSEIKAAKEANYEKDKVSAKQDLAKFLQKQTSLQGTRNLSQVVGLVKTLHNMTQAACEISNMSDALYFIEQALSIIHRVDANTRAVLVQETKFLIIKANIEQKEGHYERAIQIYKSLLNIFKKNRELVSTNSRPRSSDKNVEKETEEDLIDVYVSMGDTQVCMGKFQDAKNSFRLALSFSNIDAEKKAMVLNSIGVVSKKCSSYDEAIHSYMAAMELLSEESPKFTEIVFNLADVYRKQNKLNDAKDLYEVALNRLMKRYGPNHPEVAEICNSLGMLEKKQGLYLESQKHYNMALRIYKYYFGEDHPKIGIFSTNLGDIYRKLGDYDRAKNLYSIALTNLEKTLGPDNIEVAETLNSLGLVYKKLAKYDEAEDLYSRAIRIVHETHGTKHYKMGIYSNNLADIHRKKGNYEVALSLYQVALTSIKETLGPEHTEAAEIIHNMGLVYHQLGKYETALENFSQALKIIKRELGESHYKYGMFLNNSGLARVMLNQVGMGYFELKKTRDILSSCLGSDHVEVADCLSNLGDSCLKLYVENPDLVDKISEAKQSYTEALRIVTEALGPDHTKTLQFQTLLFICDN